MPTGHRYSERALTVSRLCRFSRLFTGRLRLSPPCGERPDFERSEEIRGEGLPPRAQNVESPPHPARFARRPLPASGARWKGKLAPCPVPRLDGPMFTTFRGGPSG